VALRVGPHRRAVRAAQTQFRAMSARPSLSMGTGRARTSGVAGTRPNRPC